MTPFHKASLAGDLTELQRLICEGADINLHDERDGHTPLMAACLSPRAGVDVVEFLLDHGADLHAPGQAKLDMGRPVIALAVSSTTASCEKIRLLIERGADFKYRSPDGYNLLISAAYADRMDVFDLLLAAGAPVDGESSYKESALSVLSRNGRFEVITKLLDNGANPAPLEWTQLHRAIALGTLQELEVLLNEGADLEATDRWHRTAFLLSIQAGDTEKAALLLDRGANRKATGKCGKPVLHYPLDLDDAHMMAWLIGQGFDVNQEDDHGGTPLTQAIELSAVACFKVLMEAGADWESDDQYGDALIKNATHPEVIQMLIDRGADAAMIPTEALRTWIGIDTVDELPVSEQDYLEGRFRGFGNANPERMDVPFWTAMVRCGWAAFEAAHQFGDSVATRTNPVWSHDRFGMSLTRLPDGRFIQIAGEHEDSCDPDFCIYNDVIIHDGRGGFEILGYPEDVFPPTDFHSATYVAPWIYIIGSLGYPHTQKAHGLETPVYRLHTKTGEIERVATQGKSPGWIHGHKAVLEGDRIRIFGGKILTISLEGETEISDHLASYHLDLATTTWQMVED